MIFPASILFQRFFRNNYNFDTSFPLNTIKRQLIQHLYMDLFSKQFQSRQFLQFSYSLSMPPMLPSANSYQLQCTVINYFALFFSPRMPKSVAGMPLACKKIVWEVLLID